MILNPDDFDFEDSPPISSLTLDGRIIPITPFLSPGEAFDFADGRGRCPYVVLMGDCPWFWVVTEADAERLVRAGYELVPRE